MILQFKMTLQRGMIGYPAGYVKPFWAFSLKSSWMTVNELEETAGKAMEMKARRSLLPQGGVSPAGFESFLMGKGKGKDHFLEGDTLRPPRQPVMYQGQPQQ